MDPINPYGCALFGPSLSRRGAHRSYGTRAVWTKFATWWDLSSLWDARGFGPISPRLVVYPRLCDTCGFGPTSSRLGASVVAAMLACWVGPGVSPTSPGYVSCGLFLVQTCWSSWSALIRVRRPERWPREAASSDVPSGTQFKRKWGAPDVHSGT